MLDLLDRGRPSGLTPGRSVGQTTDCRIARLHGKIPTRA